MQSTFMAKIDAKDKMGTKISTNSICYQTMWSHWLYCTSLTLGFKSWVDLCLGDGRTSWNLLCSSSFLKVSSMDLPYTWTTQTHTHTEPKKQKPVILLVLRSFMAERRLRMDTFPKTWNQRIVWVGKDLKSHLVQLPKKENILKKQLNKRSLKSTFRWNACSYDKTYKTLEISCILAFFLTVNKMWNAQKSHCPN